MVKWATVEPQRVLISIETTKKCTDRRNTLRDGRKCCNGISRTSCTCNVEVAAFCKRTSANRQQCSLKPIGMLGVQNCSEWLSERWRKYHKYPSKWRIQKFYCLKCALAWGMFEREAAFSKPAFANRQQHCFKRIRMNCAQACLQGMPREALHLQNQQ